MDSHTFQKTVESLESLPESVRTRSLTIAERLTKDEDRAELARQMMHSNERVRQAEVAAAQTLTLAEKDLARAEAAFRKVSREEREERGQERDIATVEEKLKADRPPRRHDQT
ncbi:MAG: hypothetical protein PHX87_01565 [Candidatus Peribacteraceae bacterium]|nr:hypothetical protein [Candidatus Peribacteraceae bacterium]MDD5742095.1 hypothetical protein [Candidatus Peribacteraceae bacterium]